MELRAGLAENFEGRIWSNRARTDSTGVLAWRLSSLVYVRFDLVVRLLKNSGVVKLISRSSKVVILIFTMKHEFSKGVRRSGSVGEAHNLRDYMQVRAS